MKDAEIATLDYQEFLAAKMAVASSFGFEIDQSEIHPALYPFQRDIVQWAVRGGRRAVFAAFGLGKTLQQIEICRLILKHAGGGRGLITCPLGVRQEFQRDAVEKLGMEPPKFIRSDIEASADGIYLTNYESVREGKLDPRRFTVVSLDEAGVLRGFGGTKTFREFMRLYEGTNNYRFVATATPDPNSYLELAAYAGFLGIMDIGQIKTRWFKRDSTKADNLTLHPHKEDEWWAFVSSWSIFLQSPADLCPCECHEG